MIKQMYQMFAWTWAQGNKISFALVHNLGRVASQPIVSLHWQQPHPKSILQWQPQNIDKAYKHDCQSLRFVLMAMTKKERSTS